MTLETGIFIAKQSALVVVRWLLFTRRSVVIDVHKDVGLAAITTSRKCGGAVEIAKVLAGVGGSVHGATQVVAGDEEGDMQLPATCGLAFWLVRQSTVGVF